MEKRETTVTIAELATQKEAKETADQVQYREVLSALKETGSILQPEAEILSTPQDEIQAVPGIQILSQTVFLNDGRKGNVTDAKTWKETTEKRKGDKKR